MQFTMAGEVAVFLGVLLFVSWRIYFYTRKSLVSNDTGNLNHLALKELPHREMDFRSVAETVPILIARYDKEGRICYMNLYFQQYLGVRADFIIGRTLCEVIGGDVLKDFHETILSVAAIGDSVELNQVHISAADGGQRIVHVRFMAERGVDGAIVGVLMTGHDITENQQIANLLCVKDKVYQTLVENLPISIARFGLDGRITYTNPNMSAWLCGGRGTALLQTESLAALHAKVLAVLNYDESNEVDFQWKTYGGDDRYGVIKLVTEFDQDGNVQGVLAIGHDITELMQMKGQVFFDPLTGLPSRALFNDRLHQSIIDADRYGYILGLLLLDIDCFNTVNDTLGHTSGDELLRMIAERLRSTMRASDTVARLSGDEFAIIIPKIRDEGDVGIVANKIVVSMSSPFDLDGGELYLSVSIGAAMCPVDATDVETLFKYADTALYSARSMGRNNFQVYSKHLTDAAEERLTIESSLHRALQREELEVYYQPKISFCDRQVIGAEALLRWNHPLYGTLSPNRFISIAESTGLIVDIGEWVLLEACRKAVLWDQLAGFSCKIAVNVSPRQLSGGDFADVVHRALLNTGCKPEWIELEITENLLLDERYNAAVTLKQLTKLGISIAVDDFGTGYSSLIYLIRYPITTLKIDRSFINDVVTLPENAVLVRAIIVMAQSLHMQVVAEGVETTDQANWLVEAGCDVGQGYLWAMPMPADVFEEKLCTGGFSDMDFSYLRSPRLFN